MNFNYILFFLWSIVAIYWLHIEREYCDIFYAVQMDCPWLNY